MTEVDLLQLLRDHKDALAMLGGVLIFVIAPAIYVLPIDEQAWTRKPANKSRGPITYCRQHNRPRSECESEHRP